jgi:hypothetical protein
MTTLTMKEEKRLEIIQRVFRGELTVVEVTNAIEAIARVAMRMKSIIRLAPYYKRRALLVDSAVTDEKAITVRWSI